MKTIKCCDDGFNEVVRATGKAVESVEKLERRFSVTETSDAFEPGNDYAVWDAQKNDYYTEPDGHVHTFESEDEALDYLECVEKEEPI